VIVFKERQFFKYFNERSKKDVSPDVRVKREK
jgi:hypothetical protein